MYSAQQTPVRLDPAQQSALDSFFETFGDDMMKEQVGPAMTCGEVEVLANLFTAFGHAEDADEWIHAHGSGDDSEDVHGEEADK